MDSDSNILYGDALEVPVFEGTAGEQIYEALLKYQDVPEAAVCVETKQVISYRKMLETSCQLAQALQQYGVSKDIIMAMYCENSLEYMYPILASLYLGVAVATINHEYIKREFHHVINLSKPEIIFCSMTTLERVQQLRKQVNYIKLVIVMDLDDNVGEVRSLNSFIRFKSEHFLDIYQFKPAKFNPIERVALILTSSGTTGLPKGVMITHSNLTNKFAQSRKPDFMYGEKTISTDLLFTPRFHAMGLIGSIVALVKGNRSILMRKFVPKMFLQYIQDYKIKTLRVPPQIIAFLAKNPLCKQYDLSSLEDLISVAAPLSNNMEKHLQKQLGNVWVRQSYGLTETTLGVTVIPKENWKPGSIGKIAPNMAVKIVDKFGTSLRAGTPGEIWLKGPLIAKGYIGDEVATAESFLSNGWFRTGDIGYYDKDGYLFIVDRLKELIKYKGFQVAPVELEEILLEHPKISDAGVIGIPDERAGELPAGFVCIKKGEQLSEEEVLEYVSNRVSPQKHLRGGVYFVTEIPRNLTGKILRRKLRQLIEHNLSKL